MSKRYENSISDSGHCQQIREISGRCSGCGELIGDEAMFALCVEAEGSLDETECTCIDCETSSANISPTASGA